MPLRYVERTMDTNTAASEPAPATATTAAAIATSEQYKAALLSVRDKHKLRGTPYLELLKAHASAPGHKITPDALMRSVAPPLATPASAILYYGKIGHLIADELHFVPPPRGGGKRAPQWWQTLATGEAGKDDADPRYELTMRPELVAALRELKWAK